MPGSSIAHALIVAGPSGAGKSAFLRELAANRLPKDITSLLPADAHTWREVWCNRKEDWQPLIDGDHGTAKVPGIAVHFDITTKWVFLREAFERDPFWEVVKQCDSATLINIRPSRARLLRQWVHAHLGVRSIWMAYWKTGSASVAARLRIQLRRLRIRSRRRYPKPLRFLQRVERALVSRLLTYQTPFFNVYRSRRQFERMLHSWDDIIAAKLAAIPVTRIQIAPDDDAEIAKIFQWKVVSVEAAANGR
jgi:hypothetical protein